MVEILPSILAADFARLGDQVRAVEQAGVTMLHLDVMDGHFVPNISFGVPVVESLRRVTKLTLDVHLMVTRPDELIGPFAQAGADQISVHQEVCPHLDRTLRLIQSEGLKAGVVINPSTPVTVLDEVLDVADFVLVMSVNPGFGGQKFIPGALRKIARLDRARREGKSPIMIEVDGGVGPANTAALVEAGCDWLVAGSAVFGREDPATAVREMQQIARQAAGVPV
ncbi:MAG: ribulose-phosphate 3-epimerase [Acidobacteria bacterium]|nr:ribulose-phosphate 3-epimerase [Acidobacteriota bacterium]